MTYSDLKKILDEKGILLKTLCNEIGYTRAGLKPALNNETIELRKIKLLCQRLNINPSLFFENFDYINLKTPDKEIIKNQSNEIEYLKKILIDKGEIIDLLKRK